MGEIIQFIGETPYEAIINHYSIDLEKENSFLKYITSQGFNITSNLGDLNDLYKEWVVTYKN